jgi:hypothetical protein
LFFSFTQAAIVWQVEFSTARLIQTVTSVIWQ